MARAFSVRRNLRHLFVPPPAGLRPLDGIRALSVLWVMLFHAGWYIGKDVSIADYFALVYARWMLPVWRGDFGVDVFFVLSGFLIAGMLVDERERTGRLALPLFYARRMLRLFPALAVAAAAHVTFLPDRPEMVWASLLFVNNFVPVLAGTMGWTWSLAIEEQFYLVCPWVVRAIAPLSARARLAVVALVALALCGVATSIVHRGGFELRDSEIVVERDFLRWGFAFDTLYSKPWMRAGPLLMGVCAAYVYRMRGALDALRARRIGATLGFAIAVGGAVFFMHWPFLLSAPRPLQVAFLGCYRTGFGACVAYLLLFSVSEHPLGKAIGRLLSWRVLYPIGQLAYSSYLLNPIVTQVTDRKLAPFATGLGPRAFGVYLPFDVAFTLTAAAIVYVFVERPFMELRPRATTGQSPAASARLPYPGHS